MRNYILTFIAGITCGIALCGYGLCSQGPDALMLVASKWQAAQRSYTVYSMPAMLDDEERVAEAPKPTLRKRR